MKTLKLVGRSGAHGRGADIVPLYHRIYVVLLQKIADGTFEADRTMPSEDELATSFGVSRVTIRKAMERLQSEGLVRRERGRGTFPQPMTQPASNADSVLLDTQLRNQISLAKRTRVDVLDYGFVGLPANLRGFFNPEMDTEILRIERVRSDQVSPISHSLCYLAPEFASLVPRRQIASMPISATIAAAGVKLHRFHETITATLADPDIARHLDVNVGSALISMTRRVEGENGRTLELLHVLYRPDRYEYRVDYTREDRKPGSSWQAMITDSRD